MILILAKQVSILGKIMKKNQRGFLAVGLLSAGLLLAYGVRAETQSILQLTGARQMEKLGRGLVVVRNGKYNLVSWRLLASDPVDQGFNIYRSDAGGIPVKINLTPITNATSYPDYGVEKAISHKYFVKAIVNGIEQKGDSFEIEANHKAEPVIRIKISPPPSAEYLTRYVWVGDLDGDGEFDYVLDRLAPGVDRVGTGPQYLEAYRSNGEKLWQINLGPNSLDLYRINPGSSALSRGMYDGVTVYDLNGDGKAEVVLKLANGVKFPNNKSFYDVDNNAQHLGIIDGLTGNLLASTPFPKNFLSQGGALGTQLGIGYSNGMTPSVYFWGRNRNADKSFNDIFASWSWNGGGKILTNWMLPIPADRGASPSHQLRIIDIDGDGKDEVATGNFVINSDGTFRYALPGVGHGDRFYIGKFDPKRSGYQGYGVQQNNASGLREYYYDATTGKIIWSHFENGLSDVGRGIVGDVDPNYPGYEAWSFSGMYNGPSNIKLVASGNQPYPGHMIWWDGDLLGDLLVDRRLDRWDASSKSGKRLMTLSDHGGVLYDTNPMFFGDILGDWRTEVIALNKAQDEIIVYTTDYPTEKRFYTMAQNPAYRDHMTLKGYMQSPLPDYYLGSEMTYPVTPNINLVGDGVYQAEQGVVSEGAVVRRDRARYHGLGYVKFPGVGGALQFDKVKSKSWKERLVRVRYANGTGLEMTGVVLIHGEPTKVAFPPSGGWSVWKEVAVKLPFARGDGNTVRIEGLDEGMPLIDWIKVEL
ncbi:hypothetical protein [Xanthomonas citri]|uniref:rhamnogalacturonan lyase family protein n=1 Tax=Xanthomonas citri TaxID=346 RepID=UPI00103BDBB6|nr:hypothetical protein [Xanthomonas citri]